MSNKTIQDYRVEIDRIDRQLMKLLNDRATVAIEIGKIKKNNNQPVYSPEREIKILEDLKIFNTGPISDQGLEKVFLRIFEEMKNLEKEVD